jgi:hypothetical protein
MKKNDSLEDNAGRINFSAVLISSFHSPSRFMPLTRAFGRTFARLENGVRTGCCYRLTTAKLGAKIVQVARALNSFGVPRSTSTHVVGSPERFLGKRGQRPR